MRGIATALERLAAEHDGQEGLAAMAGVRQQTISDWKTKAESKQLKTMDIVSFLKIFVTTGKSVDEYVLGRKPSSSNDEVIEHLLAIRKQMGSGVLLVPATIAGKDMSAEIKELIQARRETEDQVRGNDDRPNPELPTGQPRK